MTEVGAVHLARELGVSRHYVYQLSYEDGFPAQTRPASWDLDQVLAHLRRRARLRKPGASYCATCGGRLDD